MIRIGISIPKTLIDRAKEFDINISEACREGLKIEIEKQKEYRKLREEIKRYSQKYFTLGTQDGAEQNIKTSERNKDKIIEILEGRGKYASWTKIDRIHDVYEFFSDPTKEDAILEKLNDVSNLLTEDQRAEIFFDYKHGFTTGISGIDIMVDDVGKKQIKIDNNDPIKKKDVISILNQELSDSINNRNLIYSKKNTTNDKFWFEPSYDKFQSDLYIALNDQHKKVLFIFKIPGNEFSSCKKIFRDRPEKKRVSITIEGDDVNRFRDSNSGSSGVAFKKYLINTISYSKDKK